MIPDYNDYPPGTLGLYLDDVRRIFDTPTIKWVTVRSYQQFVDYITLHGLPSIISFDHDLQDIKNDVERTGFDCAKWLVDYCIDNKLLLVHTTCHSANPAGAENIISLLNNFSVYQKQEPSCYRTVWNHA